MAYSIKSREAKTNTAVKLVPLHVVGFYLSAIGIVDALSPDRQWLLIVCFFLGLIATPIVAIWGLDIKERKHQVLHTAAFVIWAYNLGGMFEYLKAYDPALGAILLLFWSIIVPIVYVNGKNKRGKEKADSEKKAKKLEKKKEEKEKKAMDKINKEKS